VIELATGIKMIVYRRYPVFGYHTKCTWSLVTLWVKMSLPERYQETE